MSVAFRTLFFVACLAWLFPLTLLQRAMWRREWRWLTHGAGPAGRHLRHVDGLNALLGQRLAIALGLESGYRWTELACGLDGCWLALIAFCAAHAVAAVLPVAAAGPSCIWPRP